MDAQAVRNVDRRVDAPDIGERIEAAGLHRHGSDDVSREILGFLSEMIRHQPSDGLNPLCRRRRGDNVLIDEQVRAVAYILVLVEIEIGPVFIRRRGSASTCSRSGSSGEPASSCGTDGDRGRDAGVAWREVGSGSDCGMTGGRARFSGTANSNARVSYLSPSWSAI